MLRVQSSRRWVSDLERIHRVRQLNDCATWLAQTSPGYANFALTVATPEVGAHRGRES